MSGVVTDKSPVAVDRLSTRRIDEMVYIGNVAGLVNNQIINIHPVTRLDKNPAQLGSVVMAEQMGRMASRWVEKKMILLALRHGRNSTELHLQSVAVIFH